MDSVTRVHCLSPKEEQWRFLNGECRAQAWVEQKCSFDVQCLHADRPYIDFDLSSALYYTVLVALGGLAG